uniref:Putative plasma membrane protein n=1 Tax=Anopheles darlingi TaxID=43151 RepID=A0A2M4D0C2_ANODA
MTDQAIHLVNLLLLLLLLLWLLRLLLLLLLCTVIATNCPTIAMVIVAASNGRVAITAVKDIIVATAATAVSHDRAFHAAAIVKILSTH